MRPHPVFPYGLTSRTSRPDESIRAIVDDLKRVHSGSEIVLIAWHSLARDFAAIQAIVPSIFQEFVGWIDVLNIVQQL